MNFICAPCKEAADHPILLMDDKELVVNVTRRTHDKCRGNTWCDCQHRTKGKFG